jgi:hypothetical protein
MMTIPQPPDGGNGRPFPGCLDRQYGKAEADRIRVDLARDRNRDRTRARAGLFGPARRRRTRRRPVRNPANEIGTLAEQLARATGPRPERSMSRAEFRRLLARLLDHPDDALALLRVQHKAADAGGG